MAPKSEGRPILVRLPESLLAEIDTRRARTGLSRAEAIRRMLAYAVKTHGA